MKPEKKLGSQVELPAIWVGDLGDYNAGILNGEWVVIDTDTTADDIREHISRILSTGVTEDSPHEEWFIADYNNLPLSEQYPDLNEVISVAHLVHEHGYEIIKAFLNSFDTVGQFEDRFVGVYDSAEDYAYELINDCYDLQKLLGDSLSRYFNYEAYARDLELSGDIVVAYLSHCQVAIFYSW